MNKWIILPSYAEVLVETGGKREVDPFMLGWACSHRAVSHFLPAGYDVLAVYDYRTIEPFDPADFASYRSTTLLHGRSGCGRPSRPVRRSG